MPPRVFRLIWRLMRLSVIAYHALGRKIRREIGRFKSPEQRSCIRASMSLV